MTMNWTIPADGQFDNLTGIASYYGTISTGWFWPMILVAIFMVAYITLSRYTTMRALLASSFMTWVLSILLFYAGLITAFTFYGVFGGFMLALLASYFIE
jgi:hypothetical protein